MTNDCDTYYALVGHIDIFIHLAQDVAFELDNRRGAQKRSEVNAVKEVMLVSKCSDTNDRPLIRPIIGLQCSFHVTIFVSHH